MSQETSPLTEIAGAGRRVAQRMLDIGANRLELLMVEAQEARERLLQMVLLSVGMAIFALLAGIAVTAAITILLWPWSPVLTLLVCAVLYGAAGVLLYARLNQMRRDWQAFSDSLEQLRKDCECLAETIR